MLVGFGPAKARDLAVGRDDGATAPRRRGERPSLGALRLVAQRWMSKAWRWAPTEMWLGSKGRNPSSWWCQDRQTFNSRCQRWKLPTLPYFLANVSLLVTPNILLRVIDQCRDFTQWQFNIVQHIRIHQAS